MLIATYDPTGKNADAFSMANMVEGTTNKILTATERTKLSGITLGAASGNVPVNGSALGTTANVPVVTDASGHLIPHASGAIGTAAFKASGSASGAVPINGSALGTTSNVPVVTNTSGNLIPHASGALGTAAFKAAGTASNNVPINGSALGTTANVPVVTNASGNLIPHASGALGTAAFTASTAYASGTHVHGNITNDGKIGSTADLMVCTTTAGSVTTKTVADTKTLLGISSFYEKISTITDTNASTSLSVDLSTLNFSTYKEIVIKGKTYASSSYVMFRVNTLSSGYSYSYILPGSALQTSAAGTFFENTQGTSAYPTIFEIHLRSSGTNIMGHSIIKDSVNEYSKICVFKIAAASLSSLNFVSGASATIYLSGAEIWGVT